MPADRGQSRPMVTKKPKGLGRGLALGVVAHGERLLGMKPVAQVAVQFDVHAQHGHHVTLGVQRLGANLGMRHQSAGERRLWVRQ